MDLKKLNEAVKRERYVLPTADEIIAKLSGATVFSSLDAASGFWQIPLHPESSKLTTFITPFRRYSFKRLPFGRYAQIEKECLGSVWACKKFEMYLIGLQINFKLVTDHKPLVPLMNKKDLDNVPLRCQRLLMRLMRFKLTAEYAPGKTLLVADTLSWSPLACKENDLNTHSDVECYIPAVTEGLPASPPKLEAIRAATLADNNLQIALKYIQSGWPDYVDNIPVAVRQFFPFKNELSEHNGILTRGSRMLIPEVLRADILNRIHDGHQGLAKCRERASTSVWWLGISSEIKQKVLSCRICMEMKQTQKKEPLISTPLPDRPWKRLAIGFCELNKHTYLVVSEYFSRFFEILHMPATTTSEVVLKLNALFARFGCPDEIVSDNVRQFVSAEFQEFAK